VDKGAVLPVGALRPIAPAQCCQARSAYRRRAALRIASQTISSYPFGDPIFPD
jgi:hypothetical protein